MARAFVSVGSNIDPAKNVRSALVLLRKRAAVRAISTVYLTEPIGPAGQSPYYNCVVAVQTELQPLDFKKKVLRAIETDLGRTRSSDKYAPRTIDLDLLLYDEVVTATAELVLPDPGIVQRRFLAAALAELDPELVLPGSATRIRTVSQQMPSAVMQPLEDYTKRLRKEVLHE